MSEPSEIYVLGAGPAGMAAAYTLTKQGEPVVVIERDSQVGGLAKSIEYQGFILDYGPHFFGSDIAAVHKFWDEVMGSEQVTFQVITRMYWQKKFFTYPPSVPEVLLGVGFWNSLKILLSYVPAQLFPNSNPQNYAERVSGKFGKELFEVCFKAYVEKLWGIPCTEISADWEAGKFRYTSFLEILKNAMITEECRVKFPRLGSQQLYDRIANFIGEHDQQILFNHEVKQIHHENFKVTKLTLKNSKTGEEKVIECKGVISSIPLSILLQQLTPAVPSILVDRVKSLKFRNTAIAYLIVESGNLFPDQCIYINDANIRLGRVTNFANWSKDMVPNSHQTPLCCEYWCDFGDSTWQQPEAELLLQAEQDLRAIGLLGEAKVSGGFVVKLARTHPIYAVNYQEALSEVNDYLNQFENLEIIGRYGAFKYHDQDGTLYMGMLAAEKAVSKSGVS